MHPSGAEAFNSLAPAYNNDYLPIFRLNLLIIFVSMGFIAHSTPNFEAAQKSLGVSPGAVVTAAFTSLPLFTKVSRSTT
jgi:hypothetical protein